MCVAPSFPAETGTDLVTQLRANPDKYTIGTDGGAGQLASARVLNALKVRARNIPYTGASEILTSFLGGHIDIYQGSVPAILPSVKAGKAKCLILTTAEKTPALPQAAGLKDLGIAGEETPLWWVLLVPKATAREAIERLSAAMDKAAGSQALRFLVETGNPATT